MEYLERTQAAALARTHKLVGFGAGVIGAKTAKFLDGRLSYFVDNVAEKWGQDWDGGLPVRPPETLRHEDPSATIVVICTEQDDIVAEQVRALDPHLRVMRSPLLKDLGAFNKLLRCSQRLLATAYGAGGGVYLVDGRSGAHRKLQGGSYRGLVVANDKLIVATEKGELAEVVSLDPLELTPRYRPDGISQTHGLAYWPGEHLIFAAEAESDAIAVFDADTFERRDTLRLSDKAFGPPRDWHHINDLHVVDDHLLVSAISVAGWWKFGVYDGGILEYDLRRPRGFSPVLSDLCFPHSVRVIDRKLHVLEAMNGNVRIGRDRVALRLPGFIRGLDGDLNVLYIGQARNRRIREAQQRCYAVSMDSGVYVVDPDASLFRFIKLPEMCDVYNVLDLEATALRLEVPEVAAAAATS